MKKWIFSLCAGLLPLLAMAQEDLLYERSAQRYQSAWAKLIPRYSKLQFAGSIGMFSIGTGWDYYHGHWETDLLLGFVPKQGLLLVLHPHPLPCLSGRAHHVETASGEKLASLHQLLL